ncbi:hypothetical protein KQX54_021237 [Cotesia glomerata]|uniref:Uncharacterized protein n=1 Tax=Cotesia glomerata TaxID=32391 RepID=A0AAV7IUP9_COTGL|nr:hypothetical protein KQX54_021237 [Cotesia glomerata]
MQTTGDRNAVPVGGGVAAPTASRWIKSDKNDKAVRLGAPFNPTEAPILSSEELKNQTHTQALSFMYFLSIQPSQPDDIQRRRNGPRCALNIGLSIDRSNDHRAAYQKIISNLLMLFLSTQSSFLTHTCGLWMVLYCICVWKRLHPDPECSVAGKIFLGEPSSESAMQQLSPSVMYPSTCSATATLTLHYKPPRSLQSKCL